MLIVGANIIMKFLRCMVDFFTSKNYIQERSNLDDFLSPIYRIIKLLYYLLKEKLIKASQLLVSRLFHHLLNKLGYIFLKSSS